MRKYRAPTAPEYNRLYVYEATRQAGIETKLRGPLHRVTAPDHNSLRVGTLNAILSDVADYLKLDRSQLIKDLFEK